MPRKRDEATAAGITVAESNHNMKRRKSWHDYRRKGKINSSNIPLGETEGKVFQQTIRVEEWK